MSYQGYPQQQWPGGGHQQPYGEPVSTGNPGLAVISGIVGLGIAGMLGYANIDMLSDLSDAPALPGSWVVTFILNFTVVAIALLGAILVFARVVAGAFVLLAAGALAVLAILLDGLIAEGFVYGAMFVGAGTELTPTNRYGYYLGAIFEFGNEHAVLFALSLFAGGILLIIAALPPSLRYLRGRNAGYQQQGW